VNTSPSDSWRDNASGPAPLPADPASRYEPCVEADGFDVELAEALEELGRRVRPHEFDSGAIQRRTARRRSVQILAASAAGIAVVAGAAAIAVRADAPADAAVAAATPGASAAGDVKGTDPLTLPGYFRQLPGGIGPNGYTVFGASTNLVANSGGTADQHLQIAESEWIAAGTELTAQVTWTGDAPTSTAQAPVGTVVGTIDAHPAYYDSTESSLYFRTGSQGYATLIIWVGRQSDTPLSSSAELLSIAKSLDTTAVSVPMPIRVTGVDPAEVTYAGLGDGAVSGGNPPWYATITFQIDGRSYEVDASPGTAVTPSPTGPFTSTGEVWATKEGDGLGITVTTSSGKSGSPSAPTVAQVLARVTSLGTDPSNWTTSVLVK